MKTNTKGIQAPKSEGMTYNFEAVNNIIIHRPKIVELPYESTAFDFLKSWFIGEEIGEPRVCSDEQNAGYGYCEYRGYALRNCQYWRKWEFTEEFLKAKQTRFYDENHPFVKQLEQMDVAVLETYKWSVEVSKTVYNLNKNRYLYSTFTLDHEAGEPLSKLTPKWEEEAVEKNLDFFTSTVLMRHFKSLDDCVFAYGKYIDPDKEKLDKEDVKTFLRSLESAKEFWGKTTADPFIDNNWVWDVYKNNPLFVELTKKSLNLAQKRL